MYLRHFMIDVGTQEVNVFLMADEDSGEGLLVDAGALDQRIIDTIAQLKIRLTHILITHLHWDHVNGLPEYLKLWPEARVFTPAPLAAAPQARLVREGDMVQAGPFRFQVFQTSGHTPESISYYCAQAEVCFVGDAIFSGSVGGTSDDTLHAEEIGHLKKKILTLPGSTELLSGHGPLTTVAIEKAANPFLQPGFTRN